MPKKKRVIDCSCRKCYRTSGSQADPSASYDPSKMVKIYGEDEISMARSGNSYFDTYRIKPSDGKIEVWKKYKPPKKSKRQLFLGADYDGGESGSEYTSPDPTQKKKKKKWSQKGERKKKVKYQVLWPNY